MLPDIWHRKPLGRENPLTKLWRYKLNRLLPEPEKVRIPI